MSNDLINRQETYKELIDRIDYLRDKDYELYCEIGDVIQCCIENIQTTYDIDKVIDELEENASRYTKKYVTPYGNNGYRDVKAISIHNAIEIVKHGYVSDDVCEWTQSGDIAINPHTFSKYKIKQCDGLYALNTCVYCRKKIKVVE